MTKGCEAAAEALTRLLDCGSIRHRRRSHPRPPIEREDRRTGRVLGALARDAIAPRNDIVVNPFELPVEGGQLVVPPQIRKAHLDEHDSDAVHIEAVRLVHLPQDG